MNLYDKQTKLGIVVLLLAFGLIIGGAIAGYNAINSVQESMEGRKNEATIQTNESKGDSAYSPADFYRGSLTPVVAESMTWPPIDTDHHCLLVNVPPPLAYPKELSSDNTVRLPARVCSAIISSLKRMIDAGILKPTELDFLPQQ